MTVAFKELAGSPVETYGPEGFRAERVLLCAWDDREQVVEQLLGDGYEYGGRSRAQYPDKPDIVALRTRCEPFTNDVAPQVLSELTEGLNRYHGFAKLTVHYELLVPSERDDLPSIEPGTFLTYRQDYGSERMKLPGHSLAWQGEPDVPVPTEAVPAVRLPILEHHLTWHRVVNPPWEAIRRGAGTVNTGDFLGAAAAHVLLVGATAEREFVRIGELAKAELAWRIGYVFLERVIQTDGEQLAGWNHSYRSLPADDPGWDELADAHGNRPYQSTDFSPLFQFAATS